MLVQPKFRGFISIAAHPEGCAKNVAEQIKYVQGKGEFNGPKRVLVLGASTGYGLASRIAFTFAGGARTIGVIYERPPTAKRTATAGWYNTAAFEQSTLEGQAYTVNGDAFSQAVKEEVYQLIKDHFGQLDAVIYSLAAPRRQHPSTGKIYKSVLKPLGSCFIDKTVVFPTKEVTNVRIEPATPAELENTVMVMGGDDWRLWTEGLLREGLLAKEFMTLAYSYLGPKLTEPIYRKGTIGKAKDHLEQTGVKLSSLLKPIFGSAKVAINKAVVTQASSAIPVVPLYIAILFKLMKEQGTHEGCIEQMYRLGRGLVEDSLQLDNLGRIRLDDLEMSPLIQEELPKIWKEVTTANVCDITDIIGYQRAFEQLFGFSVPGIDYTAASEVEIPIRSLKNKINS
ncbi:MAG: hypothetical protein RLZ12_586 [Bacillota bacterium]|jgi:enoyl-[acyl-carrier protein] reductase/trans-2-enoyl-CoA reductase (NAD+)